MKHIGPHAIVIGASMGGLLAARPLSDFYAVVTVPASRLVLEGNVRRRLMALSNAGDRDLKLARSPIWKAPPARLLQPAVVMRVIRGNLGRRSGGAEPAPAGVQA